MKDGLADVSAANEDVWPWKSPRGCLSGNHRTDVGARVRADVARPTRVLCLFGNALRLPTDAAQGRVILRIHQEVSERLKGLARRAARHPRDLADSGGIAPLEVVAAHDLLHVRHATKRWVEGAIRTSLPSRQLPLVAPALNAKRRLADEFVVHEVFQAVRIHIVWQGFGRSHERVSTKASMRERVWCGRVSPISNSTCRTGKPASLRCLRRSGTSKSSGSQNLGS